MISAFIIVVLALVVFDLDADEASVEQQLADARFTVARNDARGSIGKSVASVEWRRLTMDTSNTHRGEIGDRLLESR